jgi:hypothetical protein
MMASDLRGAKQREVQDFFFVKKKQKTFGDRGHGRFPRRSPSEKKFFCFFFSKKRSAAFPSPLLTTP